MTASTGPIYQAPITTKPWGQEMIFAAEEGKYVGKVISVSAGHSLSLQYHAEKEETISVMSGRATVHYGSSRDAMDSAVLAPGDTIHIRPGTVHRITAPEPLTFVECSTAPAGWRQDVVRLEDAYGREGTNAP